MSFAIRFEPLLDRSNEHARAQLIVAGHTVLCAHLGDPACQVCGLDPSRVCAVYLSSESDRRKGDVRLTTVDADVWASISLTYANMVAQVDPAVRILCALDRLRPVVVPLEEALADLAD
jgi:hypothetical protein